MQPSSSRLRPPSQPRPFDHLAGIIHASGQGQSAPSPAKAESKAVPATATAVAPKTESPDVVELGTKAHLEAIKRAATAGVGNEADEAAADEAIEALIHLSCWKSTGTEGASVSDPAAAEVSRQATAAILDLYGKVDTPPDRRDRIHAYLEGMFKFICPPSVPVSDLQPSLLEPVPTGLLYLLGQSFLTRKDGSVCAPSELAPSGRLIERTIAERLAPPARAAPGASASAAPRFSWLQRDRFSGDDELFASPVWGQLQHLKGFDPRSVQSDFTVALPWMSDEDAANVTRLVTASRDSRDSEPRIALISNQQHWVLLCLQKSADGRCQALVFDSLALRDGSRPDGSDSPGLGKKVSDHLHTLNGENAPLTVHTVYRHLQPGDMRHDCGPLCLEAIRVIDRNLSPRGDGAPPAINSAAAQSLAAEIDQVWSSLAAGPAQHGALSLKLSPVMVARRAEMLESRVRAIASAVGAVAVETCSPDQVLKRCSVIGAEVAQAMEACTAVEDKLVSEDQATRASARQTLRHLVTQAKNAHAKFDSVEVQFNANAWGPDRRLKADWSSISGALPQAKQLAAQAVADARPIFQRLGQLNLEKISAQIDPLITELSQLESRQTDPSQARVQAGSEDPIKAAAVRLIKDFERFASEVGELLAMGVQETDKGDRAMRIANYLAQAQKLAGF